MSAGSFGQRRARMAMQRSGYYRHGQDHYRARVPDADVSMIRELHEKHGLGYKTLAKKFEVPVRTIKNWCTYLNRC